MLRRLLSTVLAVFMVLCAVFSAGMPVYADSEQEDGSGTFTLALASDLHFDPNSRAPGSVNVLTPQNSSIIDALLWDCVNEKPNALLLLGDITNASHPDQHEGLVEKLELARQQGLRIFALPGNHDIGDISVKDFAQYYENFGFKEACSRDSDSLSYSVLVDEHLIIMLDTDGYLDNPTEALLSPITLKWIEGQLKLAEKNGWPVFCAGHYPILSSYTAPFDGQLELEELLKTYNVPIYLCGHQHERRMAESDGLVELVVDQSTQYPCTYAVITKTEGEISYRPRKIPVTSWALASGSRDSILLSFEEYQTDMFRAQSRNTVDVLLKGRDFDKYDVIKAQDFIQTMMEGYWDGSLYYEAENLKNSQGYEIFMEIADGTVYASWVPSALNQVVPYTSGFIIRDGKLEAIEPNMKTAK